MKPPSPLRFALLPASLLFSLAPSFAAGPLPPFESTRIRGVEYAGDLPPIEFVETDSSHDPFFARKGGSLVAGLTGIPYVGIFEYAHGFSDRLTVGAFGGLAVNVPGFGVRGRYILAQPTPDFRIYAKVPLIYYPKFHGVDRWFLGWPAINAEWRRENGMRWWTGVGVVGSSRGKSLFATAYLAPKPTDETPAPHRYGSSTAVTTASNGATAIAAYSSGYGRYVHPGVWNTVQVGVSRPVRPQVTFQFEVAAVLKGLRLDPTHTWVGGPPVIVTTGLTYSF